MTTVGIVGAGSIGGAVGLRLLERNFSVIGVDPSAEALAPLLQRGASRGETAGLGAASDIVMTCLNSAEAFESVYFRADGLLSTHPPRCVIDLSTCGAALSQRMDRAVVAAGGDFVDAPVTGGRENALAGTLTVIAAGSAAAIDLALPVLRAIARKVVIVGEDPGQAQIVKVINNMLSYVALTATSEALVVGARAGLDPARVLEAVNEGSGRNSATSSKFPKHVLTRSFDFGAANDISHKDLGLFLELADEFELPVPVASLAMQLLRGWRRGREREDITSIAQLFEGWAGVTLGVPRDA